MYTEFWDLEEKPFELTPDPRYLYFSADHEEALMKLLYTIRERKGAMLLTGLYGCGKTVLSRVFLNELTGSKYEVALITNPRLSAKELIAEIIFQLGKGERGDESKRELLQSFQEILFENLKAEKETVLVIDEAQAIEDIETFEELRLLLNYQQNNRFLLTLILIGQSELRSRLKKLPQLKQRLLIESHINPLNEADTLKYLDHRLSIASARRQVFTDSAKKLVYHFSSGTPRVINGIGDMALLEGYLQKKQVIDDDIINKVVKNFS